MNVPVHLLIFSLFFSCSTLPQLYQTIDDIADDAIKIEIDKAAITKETDVAINILVSNKNPNKD